MTPCKIPEQFIRVVTKMNPEISNVEFMEFQVINNMVHPMTFETTERVVVIVNLIMNREYELKGNRNNYTEILNTLFNGTYSKYEFISFSVERISYLPEKTNMQKFQELFS